MDANVLKRHLDVIKKGMESLIKKQKEVEKQLGIVSEEEATCCAKIGTKIKEGLIIGQYVKVKLFKKDGNVGNVTKFVCMEGE